MKAAHGRKTPAGRTKRWVRKPPPLKFWQASVRASAAVTYGALFLWLAIQAFRNDIKGVLSSAAVCMTYAGVSLWSNNRAVNAYEDVQQGLAEGQRLRAARAEASVADGLHDFLLLTFFYPSACCCVVVLALSAWFPADRFVVSFSDEIVFAGAASFAAWRLAAEHKQNLEGVFLWTSTIRALELLRAHQASHSPTLSGPKLQAQHAIDLDHLELLARIQSSNLPSDLQFPQLGLVPETRRRLPPSWWSRVPESDSPPWPTLELVDEFVDSNNRVIERLKILIDFGLVYAERDRLQVTVAGREALALPSSLYVSTLPARARAALASADMKFRAGDYEGCTTVCGIEIEAFLKDVIYAFVPAVEDQNSLLKCMDWNTDVAELAFGKLAILVAALLDVRRNEKRDWPSSAEQWLAEREVRRRVDRYRSEPRREFIDLLSLCNGLRNTTSHDKDSTPSHDQKVGRAYRLLHLTRMAISSFCSESGIDPSFAPVAGDAAASGGAVPEVRGSR
jgi:hypothetical protein